MRPTALALIAVVAAALSVGAAQRLDAVRPFGARARLLYVPPAKDLALASAGFERLMADSLYLWAIQYASDPLLKGQDLHLSRVFGVITDLAPRYEEPYFVGAFILATDAGKLDDALGLLDKGYRVTGHFMFPYDAGFYCFMYARDYRRARHYFELAAKRPDCPIYVTRLALKMAMLVDPREAFRLYRDELRTFEAAHAADEIERDSQMKRHVHLLHHRICEIESSLELEAWNDALAAVTRHDGATPASMERLRERARALGVEPAPVEPANDPALDCFFNPYVVHDGAVVAASDIAARAGG